MQVVLRERIGGVVRFVAFVGCSAAQRYLTPLTVVVVAASLFQALASESAGQSLTEYPIPSGSFPGFPAIIITGPDGNLWFTENSASSGGGQIAKITPAGRVIEYVTPSGDSPSFITKGPDGNLWFTEYGSGGGEIGKITPAGFPTEYPISGGYYPTSIVTGPDGNLWFTEYQTSVGYYSGDIGKITPAGVITHYATPSGVRTQPSHITTGPDGNLWFTEYSAFSGGGQIAKITLDGVVDEFPNPPNSFYVSLITGPDGNLWFTGVNGITGTGRIGEINPAGDIIQYAITIGYSPTFITTGPDGNVWFTANTASLDPGFDIGSITPDGFVTEYAIPTTRGYSPTSITTGPDGNVWFTAYNGNISGGAIGRITLTGDITQYTPSGFPTFITTGPDGNLWFTESGNVIGRVKLSPAPSLSSISVAPMSGRDRVLSTHTVIATLMNATTGVPVAGSLVGFTVTAGPNSGASGTCAPSNCTSDASGQVSWTYEGTGGAGVDSLLAFVDSNANGRPDASEAQSTAAEAWFGQRLAYYALGDSIASGYGLPNGGAVPVDASGNPTCQVSTTDAYPVRVCNGLRALPQYTTICKANLACNGAKASPAPMPTPPLTNLPQQINEFLQETAGFPPDQLILVSVTIGADNFDFRDELIHGTNICNPDDQFAQWVSTTSANVELWLIRDLNKLLQQPNVYVVVTDYPNPFNPQSGYFDILQALPGWDKWCKLQKYLDLDLSLFAHCNDLIANEPFNAGCSPPPPGSGSVTATLFERTERAIDGRTADPVHLQPSSLNQAILDAVTLEMSIPGRENRLGIATIHDAFQGHESAKPNCGGAGPDAGGTYIQYPAFAISPGTLFMGATQFLDRLKAGNDCIHPAQSGTIVYAGASGVSQGVLDVAKQLLP